ncbi:MAG: hypothetical protein JSW25_05295 [Thermoplasmata archaeon]|nr:MAG: hypothetical protein JSW25_05295 [Thermoplasmata archaeon]
MSISFVRLANVPHLRWGVLALLAIMTLMVLTTIDVAADGPVSEDAGNDLDNATAVDVGSWKGSIFRNATEEDLGDYYVFAFVPGSVVQADVSLSDTSTTHLDVSYRVFDTDRAPVVTMGFPRLGLPMPFAVLANDEVTEPAYYLGITWDGSSLVHYTINYTLTITMSNHTQDDAMSGTDAPRDRESAFPLPLGEHNGSVGGMDLDWVQDVNADGGDMYVLNPEVGLFLKVELTLTRASIVRDRNLAMGLENSTGGVLDFVTVGAEGQKVSFRYYVTEEQDLYLNLTSAAVINNYTLRVLTLVPGADGDGRADAGEDPDHAMDLDMTPMPGMIMRGHGAEDLADFFELDFTSSQFLEASLTLRTGTASPAHVRFRVLDYTKAEVVNFTFAGLDDPHRFAALTNSKHATLSYYMAVTWEGPEDVDFEFRYELVHVVGPAQDDMGTGRDVVNTTSGSPTVSLDTPVTGSVGGSSPQWEHDNNVDGSDLYEVLPTSGKFVVVSGSLDAFFGQRRVGFDVQLEDQSGDLLLKPQSVFEVGDDLEMRLYVDSSLPIYVRVTSEAEMCNYTLVVRLEDPPSLDLTVGNLTVTPQRPGPGTEATITVIVASTALINPATQIRVEVYASGNLLDYSDVIFDNSDQETVTFGWTVPSSDTEVTAVVDTLNAIPWEPKDNNAATIQVKVGGGGDGPQDDDNGRGLMFWIMVLVVVIIVAIVVAVAYAFLRGGQAEDEDPEDY